ncbi:hypothetical protein CBS9595_003066 [Malassezia furfur]|nr:hypothetical protein CBS9595_003066 [Malassezia furfur]
MRLVCWNVNGLRTLKGFQPWYALPSWEACLEELRADMACFQEMKMTRKQLQHSMCVMDAYEAFYDLHPSKGYSGTATYIRKDVCMPLQAERGITGQHSGIGGEAVQTRNGVPPDLYAALDAEGRSVVLDCGFFVLINVYAPNETGPERVEYKMAFYHALEERVRLLIARGREVVVVGDMNVIAHPMDHCEGAILSGAEQVEFMAHPARSWFQALLAPRTGILVDVTRSLHPHREKMYTCWNTLIDARPANYGTRLDYILLTPGLVPWVAAADIQPQIYGSDHCPVFLELHDTRCIDGKDVRLADVLHGQKGADPGAVLRQAASQYDEFSVRTQPKLLAMFRAQADTQNETKKRKAVDTEPSSATTPSVPPSASRSPPRPIPKPAPKASVTSPVKRRASAKAAKSNQPNLTHFFQKPVPAPSRQSSETDAEASSAPAETPPLNEALLIPMARERPNETAAQWNTLFTPHPPPLCNAHREPAKSWIVNKPGINQGRKFWLCSRPVGPGYQNNKGRDAANSAYRCDYFAWDSDVKRRQPKPH